MATALRVVAALFLVAVGLAGAVVAPAGPAGAAVVRPFTSVFSQQTNGSIQITGNTVMTCGAALACTQAQSGTTAASNNNFTMTYLDADSDPGTTRSSSANLTIPSGARVIYAGLFWGAARTAGTGGTPSSGAVDQIKLRVPGAAGYSTLTADRVDNQTSGNTDYSAYRNVTTLVQGAGAGTYWGADLAAATGADRYGGWSLVVAIEDPSAPLRDLTVFSGYAAVTNNDVIDTTISGFLAPPAGAVGAKFGTVTYEGDNGITGDYLQVGTTRLADALSPSANFFTSRISAAGVNLTNRNPSSVNNLGVDAKVVDAPGVVPNGATSANVRFATSGDFYYPAVLTTQIDLYAPTIQGTKSVTNLSGNSPAKVGDVLEYSLTFSNTGDDAAVNSVVNDPLPPNTTYVPGSIRYTAGGNQGGKTDAAGDDQAEYDAASRTIRARIGRDATATTGGALIAANTSTLTFQVRVDPAAAGTTVRNTATLAYRAQTIGRDYSYQPTETASPVADEADVAITKTASPDTVTAGNQVTYTLTTSNAGPSSAAGVQVVDTLPSGTTYVSSSPTTGSCTVVGQTLTCGLGALTPGASATVTVVVRVPADSDATSLTNVARVSSTTSDPNPANNNASISSSVVRQADLALTKSATPTSPVPGNDVTYTLVASNNGASRAAAVRVTDTLPSSLLVRSANADQGTCTITGSQVSCTVGALEPNQTVRVTVVATVPSSAGSTALTNAAGVTSSTADPTPANNSASATITPTAPRADLVVTKRAVTSPVVAGRPVQYVVTVSNDGPSDAAAVTLADVVPTSISAITATATAGSCAVTAGTVSCALGALPAGRSVQITIDGLLAAGATGTLINSATASSPTTDPAPGNNTGTTTVAITASADLAVTKSAAPVVDGTAATYTIVVINSGPSVARAVQVSDPVPAPLTHLSSSSTQGTCTAAGNPTTVTCAVGDLAAGASATVTVRAQTPADGSARGVSNTASVSSPTPDPAAGNNTATYVLPTAAQADLSLAKTVTPNPVVAGGTVTWRLTARNSGPSLATGVTITDTVAARVTGVSATTATPGATCAPVTAGDVSCTAPTLAPGADFEIVVSGTVQPSAATGALANDASVSAVTPDDPSTDNNTASASTEVVARADLVVTKTGPATVTAGTSGAWAITVRNDGPSTATGVRLVDSLPPGTSLESSSSTPAGIVCQTTDGDVVCQVGTLAPGAQVTVTVVGAVSSALTAGTTLVNTAAASASTPDPTPGNNSDDHSVTVAERSDVRLAKAADPVTLVPGAESSYLLTVTNGGPSDARTVVVTDTLDADLTVLDATIPGGTCDVVDRTVTCRVALLPTDAALVARIRVLVDPQRQSPVTNTASVTSSSDATPGNNTGSVTSTVEPDADLQVVKTASTSRVAAGEGLTYTLTVVNNGPSVASAATVDDVLPVGISPVSATSTAGTCTITGQRVQCAVGDVRPGTPVVVTIDSATTAAAAPGTRTNEATVATATSDTAPANNTASVDVDLTAEADVQVTKAPDTDTFVPGRQVSWSIVFNNAGPSTARNVVVTDTVPAGVSVTSAIHGTTTPCAIAGQQVTCDLGDRAPGQRVITVVGTLASGYPGTTLANTVRTTTTTPDPVAGNDTATATAGIVRQTDLEIVKTVSDQTPVAGQRITYTLSAYNNGPSDAGLTQFIDQLPAGLTNVVVNRPTLQGTPATAECELRQPVDPGTSDNPTAPTVFCSGPQFRAGLPARVIGSIEATVAPGFTGPLTNTARISSDTIDTDAANNESTVTTAVTADADVSITKTVSPATPVPGRPVTWTVTVRNDGPSTARNVVVRDDVDDTVTGLTAGTGSTPNPCSVATGNDVTCALGDLGPGTTVTITLTAGLPAGATGRLDNTATVSSPTDTTPGNNTATATSTPVGQADVSITKTVTPATPVPGRPVTWTVTVRNDGPSTARNVVVRDDVDDTVTGLTAGTGSTPNPCSVATGNDVTCALGDLGPGTTVTITLTAGLPAGATGRLDNTATVSSPTDTTPDNNTVTATSTPAARADLSVTKSVSPFRPVPGQPVRYTIVVTNNGPSTARSVTVEDPVPTALAGVRVTSGTTPERCGVTGNLVDCALGDLDPATTVTITVVGDLPPGFTGDLVNTATVSSPTDPVAANNTATASGSTDPQADVSVTKSLAPTPPVPGRDVTYTLVVTNNGPSVARGVTLRDDVSDDLVDVRVTSADAPDACAAGSGNVVSCSFGALPATGPGSSVVVTITGGLPEDYTGALDNTATVDSITDSTPANNSATVGATAAPTADVSITKSLSPNPPVPGQPVTYTVLVTNAGPSVARDLMVEDDADDRLTGLTATAPCAVAAGNAVSCALGDLAPGASTTLLLSGGLPAGFTGVLDNTATVDSPTDTTPANNTASADGLAAPTANVSISKVLAPSSPVPGRDVRWTVVVSNAGPSVARDVVVEDNVDDRLTGLTATAPCAVAAGEVSCALGDLAPGASTTLTLTGGLPAGFTGVLDNTATVDSPTDTTPGNNAATATGTAAPNANVGITKTVAPSNPVPGEDVTWTVVVGNTGPSVARAVVVDDDVNDAVTDLTATAPCTVAAGNRVGCELGDLAPGDQVVLTFEGGVPADFTGELSNTATTSSPTDDTPANNSATANPTTVPGADLSIIKTASPAVPVPGQDVTWTVTVTNAGPSVARDAVITDDVVEALTGVTASRPCTVGTGNDVTCELGDIGVGGVDASRTVTITGRVPADFTGDLGNTATVTSPTDANTGNNSSSTEGTAEPSANLGITKTAAPAAPVPGADTTWTVTVTNAGPSVATDVVIRDDVADQLADLTATSDRTPETCEVATGNVVTCQVGTMPVGETLTVTITGRVPAGFDGDLDNTATVSSPDDDTPGNDQASTSGTAAPQADVSITKTAAPADPVPGAAVTWTLVVSNAGPSVARDVVVADDVLDAVTALVATDPCDVGAANLVTCDVGDLASGESLTLTVTGDLPAAYTGPVDNTATVESPTDTTPDNNEASTAGDADAQADVSITKTATPLDPVPGQDVTWTIGVTNAGPSVARDVVVTDDVIDQIDELVTTGPCTITPGNVVTCVLGDVGPGDSRTVTIVGRVPVGFRGAADNTATMESPTDTTPDNNEASTEGDADAQADVSVTKTVAAAPVPGQTAAWTVVVTNAGPSTARDVTVEDDVLDDLENVTVAANLPGTPCSVGAGNVVFCLLGDLVPGSSATITVRGQVPASYTGAVDNTVTVASPTDTTPDNNEATTESDAAPSAAVSVTKVIDTARPVPGQQVRWRIEVTNAGPSTARDVVLTDDVPAAVSGVAATSGASPEECTVAVNAVDCDLGDLAPGTTRVVTVRGTLDASFTGDLSNTAKVATPTDATPGDNTATATTPTTPVADLSITKAMEPVRPVAGDDVAFTMVISNAGPSTARQVVVQDTLIESLASATASIVGGGACRVAGQQVTCELEALARMQSVTITVRATVDAGYRGEVANVATVASATTDPDQSNNTARVTETGTGSCVPDGRRGRVVVCPDLAIDKQASTAKAAPGDRVTWTVTVTNEGPSVARDVEVTDTLDADLDLVSVDVVVGTAEVLTSGRRVTGVFGVVRPHEKGVLRIVTQLVDDARGTVPNTAIAFTDDPDGGDVEVQDQADVQVLAEDDGGPSSNGGGDGGDGGDGDGGVLPDTGLPVEIVPLAALSVLLLALGAWMVRRSRPSRRE
ncbi:DUF11 domain-containing protein [Nocardioides okcheonensis]|uniref:DUF11 domain-containing protein n=1 Tax=Nocardioides okcheonensis TaxID=2894081 RepID=UPI001E5AB9B4|nr:DUF11 domain-containing protein [Nocardioides okcheonensis]UFN45121.1 DUF11 domain-containing protein [Nocardioides okcheonensis]